MSRVLLIGSGPLPTPQTRQVSFPQLRLARFHEALSKDHSVRVVSLGPTPLTAPAGPFGGQYGVNPEQAGWLAQLRELSEPADLVVSAGPYRPGEAACLIAGDRPVWADLPGDPFAELQAVALAPDAELDDTRVAAAHASAMAVLSRADRISVISERQRLALIGQLGLLGRLTHPPEGIGTVVPIGYGLRLPQGLPRRRRPDAPLVVALCGGFNTWFDDVSLTTGLSHALQAHRDLTVIVTGGAIAGHYTAGFERFERWRTTSPHRSRVSVRGWVQHEALPAILSEAHLGVYVDRPGCEATLGSRTRVHLFTWMGLEVMGTPGSELTHAMSEADVMHPITPQGLGEALSRVIHSGSDGQRARRAHAWLSQRYSPAQVTQPLRAWARAPSRSPAAPGVEALLRENIRLRDTLREIHQSPTWRVLSRLHQTGRTLLGLRAPED